MGSNAHIYLSRHQWKGIKKISIETDVIFTNGQVDNDGNLYLQTLEYELYFYNLESQKLKKIEYDGFIQDITRNKEGKIILFGQGNDLKDFVYQINPNDMTLQKYVELDGEIFSGTKTFTSSEKFEFSFYNDVGLWGYSKKENKLIQICDYNQLNIDAVSCIFVGEMSDGGYYYYEYDAESQKNQLYVLCESEVVDNRKSLYLVGINIPTIIHSAVFDFNRQNTQYKIEVKDFGIYEKEAEKKLIAHISEGEQTDILCLNELNINDYMEKGVLLDLYNQTEEFKDEVLLSEVIDATKKEGALYYITPGFIINTAITKMPELYNEAGIDSSKAIEVMQRNQSIELVSNLSKEAFFETICFNNGLGNMNDSKEFFTDKDILTRVLLLTDYIPKQKEEITVDELQDYNILLTSLSIVDFNDFLVYSRMYGDFANYIGNITEKGSGCTLETLGMGVGVCANTSNQEGAISFIEMIVSNEFQKENCYPNFFPTNKATMDSVIKATMNTEEYIDENGNLMTPYACEITYDDYTTVITSMTKEEKEKFDMLLKKSSQIATTPDELKELMIEEARRYFHNEVSLEEVVDNIQNRVNTYLKEKE